MTHPPMTLQRFLRLVEAYGSQLSRFPDAERGAAEALLRVSEPARAALAEESELDGVLETFALAVSTAVGPRARLGRRRGIGRGARQHNRRE